MPDPIGVELELVTPAYIGGADALTPDCLGPPAVNSALRMWRCTRYPNAQSKLYLVEARIFGASGLPKDAPDHLRAGQGVRIVPRGDWRRP